MLVHSKKFATNVAVPMIVIWALLSTHPISSINLFWIVLGTFCIAIFSEVGEAIEDFLLMVAVTLGVLPALGWFSFFDSFNSLKVLVSIYLVKVYSHRRDLGRSSYQDIISLVPVGLIGVGTYAWWAGFAKGTPTTVLERLLPIWDLSSHFNFFYSALSNGVHLPALTAQLHSPWSGHQYPAGIHYVWAAFARSDRNKVLSHPEAAIPIFANSVVVTLAISVSLLALCGWRISNQNWTRFAFATVSAGLACSLVSLGPLSQTISTGFANIPAVVIPLAILISTYFRPLRNSTYQLVVVSSCLSAIAFNWYPALLLVAPLVLHQVVVMIRNNNRVKAFWFLMATSLLVLPPVLQTLSLGISHINLNGGIQPFPPGLLVVALLLSVSVGSALWAIRRQMKFFIVNVVPFPAAFIFALWLTLQSQGLTYYFQKFMLFTGFFAVFATTFSILFFIAEYIEQTERSEVAISMRRSVAICSLGIGFACSQIFGYWGLAYPAISGTSTAYGVLNRNEITKRSQIHIENAQQIVELVKKSQRLSFVSQECSVLIVPAAPTSIPVSGLAPSIAVLTNVWYHSLTGSYTELAQKNSYLVSNFSSFENPAEISMSINSVLDPNMTCVHSSASVIENLRKYGDGWSTNSHYYQ
jgi:hypothetical protein